MAIDRQQRPHLQKQHCIHSKMAMSYAFMLAKVKAEQGDKSQFSFYKAHLAQCSLCKKEVERYLARLHQLKSTLPSVQMNGPLKEQLANEAFVPYKEFERALAKERGKKAKQFVSEFMKAVLSREMIKYYFLALIPMFLISRMSD